MDKFMFQQLMKNLSEIDFDGRIDFSRYHEPLSHKEDILERCRIVNYYIPKAKISINTNADYLDRQYIDELIKCYVDNIAIQAYLKNGVVEYDEQGVFKRINQICKKINVPEINPDDYKDTKIEVHGDDKVPSIAIIPFENKGAEEDVFYAYGISADLISDCTRAGLIRVSSLEDIEKTVES